MSGNAEKITAPIDLSDLDAQKEQAIKNYQAGMYRNIIKNTLTNRGTKCAEAVYDYKNTSELFAPFVRTIANCN